MAPKAVQPLQEVYLLPLTDLGDPDIQGSYIYLPPPTDPSYIIRFAIEGASSICRHGSLWINIPQEGHEFVRDQFREIKLRPDFNKTIEIDVPVFKAGAFSFYTTYIPLPEFSTGYTRRPEPTRTETHYLNVAPLLLLNAEPIPPDALSIFSIISKFMGRYPKDWDKHLDGVGKRGYNMVHFTPLVERGESNSPYSIFNQLEFDTSCFPKGEKDVENLVTRMEHEYGLLGLTDVVWNHTANNSKWLQEHPEAGYNVETAPWLDSALELDNALLDFGERLESLHLPTELKSTTDLQSLIDGVQTHVIKGIRLWEYYVVNVDGNAESATQMWIQGEISFPPGGFGDTGVGGLEGVKDWSLEQKASFLSKVAMIDGGRLGGRYARTVNPNIAAALLTAIFGRHENDDESTDAAAAQNEMVKILDVLNISLYKEYDGDNAEILHQLRNRIKHLRVDDNGPKLGPITKTSPLIESYFTRLPQNTTTSNHSPKMLSLVNNGWIWNANAMIDNAGSSSKAYTRREVIVWSDCVKLRYGSNYQDNPWLWQYMAEYTRLMAKYFCGFRIDNCHSTPLVVAEYLLDEARKVRPNLFVCAELFTGSEEMDYTFVKRLGLSCLIREAMQAWSTAELSRLVHIHGGRPIGSFELDRLVGKNPPPTDAANGTLQKDEAVRTLKKTPVHALFMDCTHDNEVPAQKRDARDTLPNGALVSMCSCAIGSVMGYDEIYPKLIDLVHETRLYTSPSSSTDISGGIGGVKKILNGIHTLMGKDGYDEMHVHHEGEYITVHRVHPKSRKGYFLIAHTAFPGYGNGTGTLSPVHLTGTKAHHLGSWTLEVDSSEAATSKALASLTELQGLPSQLIALSGIKVDSNEHETIISIPEEFPPGSIALFETWIPGAEHSDGLYAFITGGATAAFESLDLIDLNFVLYRCDAEERDSSDNKDGVYEIPNFGPLVYAGLQGWWSVLRDIIKENNLGHPLCQHLRDGQWALDYIVGRLGRICQSSNHRNLSSPAKWLKERFDAIRVVPSFLLPRYFALVIQTAYYAARNRGISLMNDRVQNGQGFVQSLAMVSVQQTGFVKSTSLYPEKMVPCLAAGLPHFSTDWARCWGRDVFISLRGLFLGTGRYDDAKSHILAFASVLKHGMIPNLLSGGRLPRYNARDSVWFFLQSIQDYTMMVPDGISILQEIVKRRFLPYDDTWFEYNDSRAYSRESTIEEVIQEAMQRHASGLSFRESNAGPNLDMQMKPDGFQIDINVDWTTGLIFGGNQSNCGTWQDKMGESDRAGSKGVPGTPRDGAAIEITGLLYSTLVWLTNLYGQKKYSYDEVDTGKGKIKFREWAAKIQSNFERCYYVPLDSDEKYEINPLVVNRRGIYKDLYKSGKEFEDYQLRANFPIAMCVAPHLFTPKFALQALAIADSVLRGPTGMATLDPKDLNYRPYYNNSEDSNDFATAKGRNYHQGPEWLWPTGFFLRALLKFDLMRRNSKEEKTESFQQITRRLAGCKSAIKESPWAGLTELTNKSGEYCSDSSPTQAWSAGCLLDLFCDASHLSIE